MPDRELLVQAAEAAGLKWFTFVNGRGAVYDPIPGVMQPYRSWNPLEDDGDALRLAVQLRIDLHLDSNLVEAYAASKSTDHHLVEALLDDPHAATRRAIVRAAAAITQSG